jgi:hypothetical protein
MEQVTIKNRMISPFQLWRCVSYQIINSMMIWFLDFFQSGVAHSPILGAGMRLKPSTGQGLSNESKFMKIGRLEPEIWVDKEIASKWKIYISKLEPIKGIEGLIIIIIKRIDSNSVAQNWFFILVQSIQFFFSE